MTRAKRKIIACCTALMLIFTQLAAAAYDCPIALRDDAATARPMAMAAAKPCHESQAEDPNLCKQHCDLAAQSVDNRAQGKAEVPITPMDSMFLTPAAERTQVDPLPVGFAAFPGQPPLYIHHCRFLI